MSVDSSNDDFKSQPLSEIKKLQSFSEKSIHRPVADDFRRYKNAI
jgi:hypothetical protein